MAKIYVAKTAFAVKLDGKHVAVRAGTTVREGHPLLEGRLSLFEQLSVDYEVDAPAPSPKRKEAPRVEQATAAPGEVRDVSPAPKKENR